MCKTESGKVSQNAALQESLAIAKQNAKTGLLVEHPLHLPGCYETIKYVFVKETDACPATVHENLWEQAKLNVQFGLYRVNRREDTAADGAHMFHVECGDVFQLRGYDIANMTIVKDVDGWIVMDVLMTTETARAVWKEIVRTYLDKKAVISTVIYSHSHVDHYGGIEGLKPFFLKDTYGNAITHVIAPEGFTKHAVSENIYVGTAMIRRGLYHLGTLLPIGATGHVDTGIGTRGSFGESTILAPTREVGFAEYEKGKKYCDLTRLLYPQEAADEDKNRVQIQIQLTPGTEAPAEMNVYLPQSKVLFIAENCTGTLHNALTPRGAQVRDLLAWSDYLDETITTFADVKDVCSSHNWPTFGHTDVVSYLELQRDMYRYIHNATLHLTNLGYTIDEVGRMLSGEDGTMPLPKAFESAWTCHGFYGSYNHDAKAVYQRYIGWFDGNPSHLNREKPTDRADLFAKYVGAEALADAADAAFAAGQYAFAAELYDILFYADKKKEGMKKLSGARIQTLAKHYASALRQLGYRSEASTWRNFYLTGAMEVESTVQATSKAPKGEAPKLVFPDNTIRAMSLPMILQFMGIMLSSVRLERDGKEYAFNITVQQDDETSYAIAYARRGILGYRILPNAGGFYPAGEHAISIKGSKMDFFKAFIEKDLARADALVHDNAAKAQLKTFIEKYLIRFYLNFPIMTPRKAFDEGKTL